MAEKKEKNYFLFLKKLVFLEENEENEEIREEFLHLSPQERELRGKALLGLALAGKGFSPAEHILATFAKPGRKTLPLFSLEVGDIVSLFAEGQKFDECPIGTVYEKTKETLTVAFNDELPDWVRPPEGARGPYYQLHRSVNRVTYKRMAEALDAVYETQNTRLAGFRDISLGEKKVRIEETPLSAIEWFDGHLNASQKKAVAMALAAKDVALVHGPPGTGKTTALIEIIRQAIKRKERIFVAAPSNTACDNILEMLVAWDVKALRLGHPARITASLREHTLDFRLALHPHAQKVAEEEARLRDLMKKFIRYKERRSPGPQAEKELRDEISRTRSDIRKLERQVYERVMKETDVILGTPTSVQDRAVRELEFDLVVIDEATQATEPMAWIPIMKGNRIIMAGDHFQLPPTVRSKEAEAKGLGVTLFERFYDILGEECRTLLERQYRMNEKIMGFSSKKFYKNLLVADESVKAQTLAGLKNVKDAPETKEPLIFIDTAGKGFREQLEQGSESRYNPEEAALVLNELDKMLKLGVPASEVAVISPYSAQVRLLASKSPDPNVEIDSVDGFQGREKELVIVSLVRSNLEGDIGFLNDTRRMNVAMTRARRKLIVVGDSATIASLDFYKDFIEYAESVGGYKTAWEIESA